MTLPRRRLEELIRPSGFYRQMAERLRILAEEVTSAGMNMFLARDREDILRIHGIGPETADSILLYAGKRPFFVADTYTIRLFGLKGSYEEIRAHFEKELPHDWKLYQEFHALIVQKNKRLQSRQ